MVDECGNDLLVQTDWSPSRKLITDDYRNMCMMICWCIKTESLDKSNGMKNVFCSLWFERDVSALLLRPGAVSFSFAMIICCWKEIQIIQKKWRDRSRAKRHTVSTLR